MSDFTGTDSAEKIKTGVGLDNVDAGGGNDVIESIDADGVLNGGEGIDQVRILRASSNVAYNIDLRDGHDADIGDGTALVSTERLWFEGGSGDDTILAGDGNDFIKGGVGADFISAGGGSDLIVGGFGDTISAGAGHDRIYVQSRPTFIDGGADNDIVTVTGTVRFSGGSVTNVENFEVITGASADLRFLEGGTRIKVIERSEVGAHLFDSYYEGHGYGAVVFGTKGADVIVGSGRTDWLSSGGDDEAGGDKLYGGGGDDILSITSHAWKPILLDGGDGSDFANVLRGNATQSLVFDLSLNSQDIGDGTTLVSIEAIQFQGGSGHDYGIGGDAADTFFGGAGDDYFQGRGGENQFEGGTGNDVFIGGDSLDVAYYDQNYVDEDFFVSVEDNVYTVVSAQFGTDTYIGVEAIVFRGKVHTLDSLLD